MKYLKILIGGYEALINSNGIIVETDDKIKKLRFQKIDEVFQKYRKRAAFERVSEIDPPLIIGEAKYKLMVKKNPSLKYLLEKFDCDVY